MRIGVPVDPFDLLRGADPLCDFAGRESLKKGIRCKSFKINAVVIAL
jgi:hypothetical protein